MDKEAGTRMIKRGVMMLAAVGGVAMMNVMRKRRVGEPRAFRKAITVNRPPDEVARYWQESAPGTEALANVESVRFEPAPGGRGTEIHVELRNGLGGTKVSSELHRLKQALETGEVVHS
jgi:uncharacterized membrane protein